MEPCFYWFSSCFFIATCNRSSVDELKNSFVDCHSLPTTLVTVIKHVDPSKWNNEKHFANEEK